jgi:sulfate transport system permease protein
MTMPLQVEALYQDYDVTAAFAVASLLALLALVTLAVKRLLESTRREEIGFIHSGQK